MQLNQPPCVQINIGYVHVNRNSSAVCPVLLYIDCVSEMEALKNNLNLFSMICGFTTGRIDGKDKHIEEHENDKKRDIILLMSGLSHFYRQEYS